MAKKSEYTVGYGKPPKSGQFQKGQSGNPKGRPKGRKAIMTIAEDVLRKKITVKEGGKTKRICKVEGVFSQVTNDALRGDARATDQVLKLVNALSMVSAQTEPQDDGTLPDEAANAALIRDYLALIDISLDEVDDTDLEDE